jgi:nucleolar MIF4G domain-containing protein 1
VIKNAKDVEFDVKSISKTRMQHIAKAYAWWIAKDCTSLMILKVCIPSPPSWRMVLG